MSSIVAAELQNVELLSGFRSEEMDELASHLISREFAAGETVFLSGDLARSLYIVLSGRIEIDLGGRITETKLAELGPAEVFGESTFFHAAERSATARCLEVTRLGELPYESYEGLLRTSSTMAFHLGANAAHILAARLQATDSWIREVLDHDEEIHRHVLQEKYHEAFHPSFNTPVGFVGLGVNW